MRRQFVQYWLYFLNLVKSYVSITKGRECTLSQET